MCFDPASPSPSVSQILPLPYPFNIHTYSSYHREPVVPCTPSPLKLHSIFLSCRNPFSQSHSTLIVALKISILPAYINIPVNGTIWSKIWCKIEVFWRGTQSSAVCLLWNPLHFGSTYTHGLGEHSRVIRPSLQSHRDYCGCEPGPNLINSPILLLASRFLFWKLQPSSFLLVHSSFLTAS